MARKPKLAASIAGDSVVCLRVLGGWQNGPQLEKGAIQRISGDADVTASMSQVNTKLKDEIVGVLKCALVIGCCNLS